jgi:RNA-directed DNA polymerase
VTNVLCRRLDRRLFLAARKLGFVYTRYADDLTFSAHDDEAARRSGQLLAQVGFIVEEEGFRPHPKKTRVLRRGRRQEVTGIVVNDGLGVEREKLRKFRALLHAIRTTGIEGKTWGDSPDVLASARGFASYVAMVSPEKGRALLGQVAELEARYGAARPKRASKEGMPAKAAPPSAGPATPLASPIEAPENVPPEAPKPEAPKPEAEAPKKKWWKLF